MMHAIRLFLAAALLALATTPAPVAAQEIKPYVIYQFDSVDAAANALLAYTCEQTTAAARELARARYYKTEKDQAVADVYVAWLSRASEQGLPLPDRGIEWLREIAGHVYGTPRLHIRSIVAQIKHACLVREEGIHPTDAETLAQVRALKKWDKDVFARLAEEKGLLFTQK